MKKAARKADAVGVRLLRGPVGGWTELPDVHARIGEVLALDSAANNEVRIPAAGLSSVTRAWYNNHYEVLLCEHDTDWGLVERLAIRRADRKPIRSWATLQQIKRELLPDGAERVGVEIYPPDDEVVDQQNWYHLWVLPLGTSLPFGLQGSHL
jgi:hypothetical protein